MGACVAATTHYAELKTFALTTDGVENASCEFDVQSLQPTYRLLTGIPGKSNAFAIAARLGLQPTIIDRAKEQVSTEDARFEDVLAELERERRRIEKMKEEAQRMRSAAQSERDRMRAERDAAEERADKMMEGARSQADNILKNARMTAETVFDELETLKKQSQKKASEQNLPPQRRLCAASSPRPRTSSARASRSASWTRRKSVRWLRATVFAC